MLPRIFRSRSKQDVITDKKTAIYRSFMRREAELGGTLFGPVPKGGRREFFCLDPTTWIWHEEWIDENGQRQIRNTRYDMRPDGVLKAQNGAGYQKVSPEEAKRLLAAIEAYISRVKTEIYQVNTV